MLTPLKQVALQAFAYVRYGGKLRGVSLYDRTVPTQTFNAAAQSSRLAVVFLPGFSSVPQMVPPGMLREVAQGGRADFVRFTHPDLLTAPDKLSYPRLIDDAVAVMDALPHTRIVLAASSFGAGMMRFVADRVNRATPDRVTGMVGWSAVTPEALTDLFERQAGWRSFSAGTSERLEVRVATMREPFFMSQGQVANIKRLNSVRTEPFGGVVTLMCGQNDGIGKPEYSRQLAGQISTGEIVVRHPSNGHSQKEVNSTKVPHVLVDILPGEHKISVPIIRAHLQSVLARCV